MSEKSEALRLADLIEGSVSDLHREAAAAELRRQHEENAELREANETFGRRQVWWNDRMFALEQQRDALLEALRALVHEGRENYVALDRGIGTETDAGKRWLNARAAIKAVEEGK
jgi:hypothetical protein